MTYSWLAASRSSTIQNLFSSFSKTGFLTLHRRGFYRIFVAITNQHQIKLRDNNLCKTKKDLRKLIQDFRIQSLVLRPRPFLETVNARIDRDRIKECGPNRACAEWLLRCGATVKWKGAQKFQTDYNFMPQSDPRSSVIEEVEAVEAGIMFVGFDHFEGCKGIRRVKVHHCPYFDDESLSSMIQHLKNSLEQLELTSCGDITDAGLRSVHQLSRLKRLLLVDLPEIRDKNGCYTFLKQALPECVVEYKDVPS